MVMWNVCPDCMETRHEGGAACYGGEALKVYISGPMTGYPDFNYPAFDAAEKMLTDHGYEVTNPANNFDRRTDLEYDEYLRKDILQVLDVDLIGVLPGWQESKGARLEVQMARALNLPVYEIDVPGDRFGKQALDPIESQAQQLVRNGERQQVYGHPYDDFSRTAQMWSAIVGKELTAQHVALMMAAVKISRLVNSPDHTDSMMDLIGYGICYERVATYKGD